MSDERGGEEFAGTSRGAEWRVKRLRVEEHAPHFSSPPRFTPIPLVHAHSITSVTTFAKLELQKRFQVLSCA